MTIHRFADLHVHVTQPDLDSNLNMLVALGKLGVKDINLVAINDLSHPVDETIRVLFLKHVFLGATMSAFGGLHYSPWFNHYETPFLEQAQLLLDLGCDGIKLIESKPNYRKYIGFGLNSKIYDPMFDMLEQRQVPILCHVNDPEAYWHKERVLEWPHGQQIIDQGWLYDSEDYLSYHEILDEALARLKRNPKLNIVFAHFLFLSEQIDLAENLLNTYPNLKFDLTPGWEMYVGFAKQYDRWRAFFETYADRILYGSDTSHAPINPKIHETLRYAIGGPPDEIHMPHVDFARMRGFDLSQEAQEKICYGNYHALIGEPKPVDADRLLLEDERMLKRLRNIGGDAGCIARLERMAEDLELIRD